MTPGPKQKTRAEQYYDYMQAMANRPVCNFCHLIATVKLGGLFCCDEHGKKYSGYNTSYARELRGETNDQSN